MIRDYLFDLFKLKNSDSIFYELKDDFFIVEIKTSDEAAILKNYNSNYDDFHKNNDIEIIQHSKNTIFTIKFSSFFIYKYIYLVSYFFDNLKLDYYVNDIQIFNLNKINYISNLENNFYTYKNFDTIGVFNIINSYLNNYQDLHIPLYDKSNNTKYIAFSMRFIYYIDKIIFHLKFSDIEKIFYYRNLIIENFIQYYNENIYVTNNNYFRIIIYKFIKSVLDFLNKILV